MIVKRLIAAVLLVVLAAPAFAADPGPFTPSPLDPVRGIPVPGIRDPLDVHDPLMDAPSAGASRPSLADGNDVSKSFESMQPRPLPGMREPVFGELPGGGPRPYWESDPLFIAPPR